MKLFLLLIAISLFTSTSLYSTPSNAETATIKGKISDKITGDKLQFATVAIEGSSLGVATDVNGEFTLSNVPVGKQTVKVRYLGYKEYSKKIELKAGQVYEMNVELDPLSIMGEEVVVSAQIQGQRAAINQQRAANAIVDIVSTDKIKEVPDVNPAESIGRLPGVSLQRSGGEGNKVVVRGLAPQFTIIEVDGVRLSGTDDNRGVGLSTLSSDILDGIELSKSLTADKDADAIGGVINLRTRVAKEGFHFDVNTIGAYNSLQNNFGNYKFTANVGNRFFDNKFGVLLDVGIEQIDRSSDRFSASYGTESTAESGILFEKRSATITETRTIRNRKNAGLVLDFKNEFMNIRFKNSFSQKIDNRESRVNAHSFTKSIFELNASTVDPDESIRSHLLSGEFKFLNTQLDINMSYSRSQRERENDNYEFIDDQLYHEVKLADRFDDELTPADLIEEYFNHEIMSINDAYLDRNSRETQVKDDITKTIKVDWKVPFNFGNIASGVIKFGGKYSKKERSADTDARVTSFTGATYTGMRNDFYKEFPHFVRTEDVDYDKAPKGLAGINFDDPDYDYGEVLNGRYQLSWSPDLELCKTYFDTMYDLGYSGLNWQALDGISSYRNDYSNVEELMAAYIMAEIKVTDKLLVVPGVRFENMNTEYSGNFIWQDPNPTGVKIGYPKPISVPNDSVAGRSNQYFFPSVNAKYNVNENITVRAAYFRSTARPDYLLLSPSMVLDVNRKRLTSYNPYLKPAIANNYDLGVSYYSNKFGLFTINTFYKEISGLLYRLPRYKPEDFVELEGAPQELIQSLEAPRALDYEGFYDDNPSNSGIPINNPNTSYYRGIEVSWQTNFWYLPGAWSGLVLDLNYSRVWSETTLPLINYETREVFNEKWGIWQDVQVPVYETNTTKMLNQPPSTWNARVGWDYKGFSSRLSFRFQGETQTKVDNLHDITNEYIKQRFRMDFSAKQKITDRLSCTFDIANITQFIDDKYIRSSIYPRSSEYYGSTIRAGLRYQF